MTSLFFLLAVFPFLPFFQNFLLLTYHTNWVLSIILLPPCSTYTLSGLVPQPTYSFHLYPSWLIPNLPIAFTYTLSGLFPTYLTSTFTLFGLYPTYIPSFHLFPFWLIPNLPSVASTYTPFLAYSQPT